MKHIRIELEDDLHEEVKIVCVRSKITMQQAFVQGALLLVANYNSRPLTTSEYAKGAELARGDEQGELTQP